jgi:hypothetical protein
MSQTQLLSGKKRKRSNVIETATSQFFTWQIGLNVVENPETSENLETPGTSETPEPKTLETLVTDVTPESSSFGSGYSLVPKKKTVQNFYDQYCSFPSLPQTSNRYKVCRSSLYKAVRQEKIKSELNEDFIAGADVRIAPRGRPTTLTPEEEEMVIQGSRDFEAIYGIITRFTLKTEARQVALRRRDEAERLSDEVWECEALLRFVRVGGEKWLKGFLKRHPEITISQTKRPIEMARAAKTQPEIVLQHFRNVAHTQALCQIQRKLANGVRVEGWILSESEGLVTREGGLGRDPGTDVLEVREVKEGVFKLFVKPLGEELQKMDPRLIAALDEKPLIPDCPASEKISTCGVRHMIGCNRSSSWTVSPVLLASGRLLLSQLIVRGGSFSSETVKKCSKNMMIHRAENGVQSDRSWLEFGEAWMKKMDSSLSDPGIVFVDGHSSHLTRAFTRLAARHSLFVICEPSNLSILLQTGDNGANAFIGSEYAREYSSIFAVLDGALSIDHRIEAILRVMNRLDEKKDLIKHSFHAVKLTGDVSDCVGWLPQQFSIGRPYRSPALPKVTKPFLNAIFNMKQFAQPWGSAVVLPLSVCCQIPPELKLNFQKWISEGGLATDEQHKRLGGSGISYQMERTEKSDKELAVRLWGPRMENWNVNEILKRKCKGRVYIAEGRCLYGDSACSEAEESEKKTLEAEQKKIVKEKNRSERQMKEATIINLFVSLGFLEKGKLPTKKVMENFASLNQHLQWPIQFSTSQKREEQVECLVELLKTTKSDTPFKGVN